MSLPIGLILLFLNIFWPGLLFLRFYYTGPFRNQFSTRIPLIRLAFYCFLPGIFLQFFALWFYDLVDMDFTVANSIEVFNALLITKGEFTDPAKHFLENKIFHYSLYSLLVCALAIGSAQFLRWFIRRYNIDVAIKILRFKNQWYYIFKGKILSNRDYHLIQIHEKGRVEHWENRTSMLVYADVLVSQHPNTVIYSGYVFDYDLTNDTNELERIYLMQTTKHLNSEGKIKEVLDGQVFTIQYSNVQNLNLTYVPNPREESKAQITKKRKEKETILEFIGVVFTLLSVFFSISISEGFNNYQFFNFFKNEFNFFQKILLISAILAIVDLVFLSYSKKKKEDRNALFTLIILAVISTLYEIILWFEIFS